MSASDSCRESAKINRKGDKMEKKTIKVKMGEETVRFTPEGKLFVEDAIRLMNPEVESRDIWERMTNDHPDILDYCENYHTREENTLTIIDSEGLDRIISLLPEYLFSD
jgi:hypothetical protein